MLPFPAADQARVAVNAMVPRVPPDVAATLAFNSGCGTIKVKVGDADSLDRVAAIRAACGPRVRIRLDANGAWDIDTALRMLTVLSVYDIELVEDPVASLEDLLPPWDRLAEFLMVILRMAVLLHRGRSPQPLPEARLTVKGRNITLELPQRWMKEHPLTLEDLEQERGYLKEAGFKLSIV